MWRRMLFLSSNPALWYLETETLVAIGAVNDCAIFAITQEGYEECPEELGGKLSYSGCAELWIEQFLLQPSTVDVIVQAAG